MTRGPLGDVAALGQRWRALHDRSLGSFFLSWHWMGPWLAATGAQPDVISVRDGDREIGLSLIGAERQRRLFGHAAVLRLNEAGDATADRAFIEYNGVLSAAGQEDMVAAAVAAYLRDDPAWQALLLCGVTRAEPLVDWVPSRRRVLVDQSPVYEVDLDQVRAAGDYLDCLSANTRSQIRRARKDRGGAIMVERMAGTAIDPALADMARLNAGRHSDNAWDLPTFRAFVSALVHGGTADDAVDLLRMTAGDQLIGYLVNFVHRGRALNYQSAFVPPAGSKDKPGLLCHAAAVDRYVAAGHKVYSLLAGRDRYKQSLSTGFDTLYWWRIERFSWGQEAEYWLRRLLRR